jgi:hypothetical protein
MRDASTSKERSILATTIETTASVVLVSVRRGGRPDYEGHAMWHEQSRFVFHRIRVNPSVAAVELECAG